MESTQQTGLASVIAAYGLRRFATIFEDLEADFSAPRPLVVTDVVARCSHSVAMEELWDLTVARRTSLVVALAALGGLRDFGASLDCSQCGLEMEASLETEELLAAGEPKAVIEVGAARFRLPTGRDQLAWLGEGQDGHPIEDRMAAVLRVEGEAEVADVERALDEADPLMRCALSATCPQCGAVTEQEADVAGAALAKLQADQAELLGGVHLLASHYHWSEREIFALPPRRRGLYLKLLAQEA